MDKSPGAYILPYHLAFYDYGKIKLVKSSMSKDALLCLATSDYVGFDGMGLLTLHDGKRMTFEPIETKD